LTVMTGPIRGHIHRIREQRLGQRIALRPRRGYEWIVHPQPPLPGNQALVNGGLVYLMEEDRDGALIVIVTRPIKSDVMDLRVMAFDDQGNGYEIRGRRLASLNVDTKTESVIE